jgi:hypothetical protein
MNLQHRTGAAAELFTAYRLTELGHSVYFPTLTQSKCDLVVEIDGGFKKVQVKKATKSEARGHQFIQVRLGGCGRQEYVDGDFDLLAMVYEERLWLFPWEFVKGNKSMSFSIFDGQRPRRDISIYEVTE